jgi:DNA-binding response OmpR family regulator
VARILIVEDEAPLAASLATGLRDELHAVDLAADGEDGLWAARGGEYELVVLDLMLPRLPGLEVCRRLRAAGQLVPILVLTARDTTQDVVAGLDAGANDDLTKPFAFEELLARVRALLRVRTQTLAARLVVGPLELDAAARRVLLEGREVDLTAKEYQLLEVLVRRQGTILGKGQLADALWERDGEPDSNAIEVHVASLRRKLDRGRRHELIHTVRGFGYVVRALAAST